MGKLYLSRANFKQAVFSSSDAQLNDKADRVLYILALFDAGLIDEAMTGKSIFSYKL